MALAERLVAKLLFAADETQAPLAELLREAAAHIGGTSYTTNKAVRGLNALDARITELQRAFQEGVTAASIQAHIRVEPCLSDRDAGFLVLVASTKGRMVIQHVATRPHALEYGQHLAEVAGCQFVDSTG